MLVHGIISDVTLRAEADARAAEASERFSRLLDVVGEHVYLAQALPDGSMRELFQGPGADRLLGGAEPDAEMANWEAAVHPDDRVAYDAFNEALAQGAAGDVEYRLIGADGVTRWVHDRAATRRREDGTFEISGIVSDVTERRRMRAELTLAHAALSRVVEAMDDHLYTLEVLPDGTLRDVYRGPNREALIGGPLPADDRAWASFLHADDRALWQAAVERLPHGEPVELEYRVLGLDGEERIVLDHLRPRREPNGALLYDGVTRDITERRRLEDELRGARAEAERRARTDELTGAYNRRHFAEIVAEALTGDARGCGLLLLDADHFKQVNDLHGHVVGDAVLVELARRLEAGLARGDCLARWGGEEFAVLLRGIGSDAELDRRAQRLRTAVALRARRGRRRPVRLTISVGATRAGAGLDSLDALVEAADRCLYVAKRHGRNRVSLVPHLAVTDAPAREPEAIAVARALALTAGTAEAHAAEVARLATLTAERMALPAGVVLRCGLGGWLQGADEQDRARRRHAARGGRGDPPSPRALRRHGRPGRPGRRRDPDRGADRRRRRRVRRAGRHAPGERLGAARARRDAPGPGRRPRAARRARARRPGARCASPDYARRRGRRARRGRDSPGGGWTVGWRTRALGRACSRRAGATCPSRRPRGPRTTHRARPVTSTARNAARRSRRARIAPVKRHALKLERKSAAGTSAATARRPRAAARSRRRRTRR